MEREGIVLHLKPGETEALTRLLLRVGWMLVESRHPAAGQVRAQVLEWAARLDQAMAAREEWDRELVGAFPFRCAGCREWAEKVYADGEAEFCLQCYGERVKTRQASPTCSWCGVALVVASEPGGDLICPTCSKRTARQVVG